MKKYPLRFLTVGLILLLLTACSPKPVTPNPNELIRQAVAATLAAIPTVTPVPPSTPYPSPTAYNLSGLFCEYQFCIGHPADMAFYDVSAQQNPLAPSSYGQGMIAAINSTLFIQVIWQTAPGTADPKFMLDLVLEEVDLPVGNLDVKLVRTMNVMYTAITSTATTILPFGAAGAWTCGDRVFAWKVYSPQDQTTAPLFEEMLARFTCGQN
ncbi:MAG: hypothetical protein IPJ46_23045 [Anaerolineales bacterium]|nr:hypothetical protein [Anaerolineales bacterium]